MGQLAVVDKQAALPWTTAGRRSEFAASTPPHIPRERPHRRLLEDDFTKARRSRRKNSSFPVASPMRKCRP